MKQLPLSCQEEEPGEEAEGEQAPRAACTQAAAPPGKQRVKDFPPNMFSLIFLRYKDIQFWLNYQNWRPAAGIAWSAAAVVTFAAQSAAPEQRHGKVNN